MPTKASQAALELRFAALLAQGHSQAEAYRIVRPRSRKWDAATLHTRASRLAARDQVRARVRELQRQANVTDILNAGQWMAQTALLLEKAQVDGNLNAAQALNRQLGQACGALTANIVINQYDNQDDAAVIERLSRGDAGLAAMLAKVMGKAGFDS